jgi:hypothetical protein
MSSLPSAPPAAEGLPPSAHIFNLSMGHFAARCLHTIATAGIADHVSDTPSPSSAIAAAAGVKADALHRILRLLATNGIFRFSEGGWSHTPLSLLLRTDHPHSMRAFAAMLGDGVNWASLGEMSYTLKTGAPAARQVHPDGVWGYYAEHQDLARQFDAAMTAKSHGDTALLIGMLDMAGVTDVADIAGGRGHCLTAILDAHPQARGILFDQASVIDNAISHPRMTKLAGDFFRGDLPAADLYLMTHILHDWSDEESITILKNLRKAARPGAKLVVYELALPEGPEPHPSKGLDIVMLTVVGGRERTAAEYAALFATAGWSNGEVIPTLGPMALHVAYAR